MTSEIPGSRLPAVRAAAAAAGVDVLLVTPGPDLQWLTGYPAPALERLTCLVVTGDEQPFLVVPRLELAMAQAAGVGDLGVELVPWGETDDPYAVLSSRLPANGTALRRVAVANQMWAEQVLRFRATFPWAEQVAAAEVLRSLRMRKSPGEIEALRRAGAAIDRVHARMGEFLRVGLTERQAGRRIADAMLEEGHTAADYVVGSGPNGASPHHHVSDRVIEAGDAVVVDTWGPTSEGYWSDCTRNYVVGGEPDDRYEEYFAVLHAAQLAAVAHARPGVTAESVDAAARTIIADAGYGEAFLHRTGHGIGVEVHEDPYIVSGNAIVLEPGMAFSVEPGIYLEGLHGARIEDIVVVTDDGAERLNLTDREYVVLPG